MTTDTTTQSEQSTFATILAGIKEPTGAVAVRRAEGVLSLMRSMEISDPDMLALARNELGSIKTLWSRYEADRTSITGPLNQLLDIANGQYQPALKTIKSAEGIIKGKIGDYLDAEERRARAEQAERDRQARIEADRQAAEAARIKREADAAALKLRQESEAAAQKLADEEAALRDQMVEAQDVGDTVAAIALQAKAHDIVEATARVLVDAESAAAVVLEEASATVSAIAVTALAASGSHVVNAVTAKSVGLSSAKSFDFEVTDPVAMMKFIVENKPELASLFVPSEKAIRQYVKALGNMAEMPGLRVFTKRTIRA